MTEQDRFVTSARRGKERRQVGICCDDCDSEQAPAIVSMSTSMIEGQLVATYDVRCPIKGCGRTGAFRVALIPRLVVPTLGCCPGCREEESLVVDSIVTQNGYAARLDEDASVTFGIRCTNCGKEDRIHHRGSLFTQVELARVSRQKTASLPYETKVVTAKG